MKSDVPSIRRPGVIRSNVPAAQPGFATAINLAVAVSAIAVLATVCLLVWADRPVSPVPGITPLFVAATLTTDLASAFCLFAQFGEMKRRSVLVLGCAYLWAGCFAVVHALSFPGALVNGILAGSEQSSPWAILVWWLGFSSLNLAAMAIEVTGLKNSARAPRLAPEIAGAVLLTLLAACAVGWFITTQATRLPALLAPDQSFSPVVIEVRLLSLVILLAGCGLGLIAAAKRSGLFLWSTVALLVLFCVNLVTLVGGARDTVGWVGGRALWFVSAEVMFLFFVAQFVGYLRELSVARNSLERHVAERTSDLSAAIAQRDALLREVYHRVKNNIQVIDSMLFLEHRKAVDPSARRALDTVRRRVVSLGLAHQHLMQSGNLEYFAIGPYLDELAANLSRQAGSPDHGPDVTARSDAVDVSLDFALPLGLIATELVDHTARHGVPDPVVMAFERRAGARAAFSVTSDQRQRPSSEHWAPDAEFFSGLRSSIVSGLVKQLNGTLTITQLDRWAVEIDLPLPRAA